MSKMINDYQYINLTGRSFDSIDPTPCHASARPQKQESTVVFSIQETDSETQNLVAVSEIATRHIRRLASSASDFLGKKVNAAVITVPTNFSDEQKEALSSAAKSAGVEVLQYISEPVAAVLAYDARPESVLEDKLIVVADLGGTRSDIAVIASRGGMYTVLSTAHDYENGGVKLDQVLIDHFAKEFIRKHKTDPRENPKSLAKLKLEAEATKRALSLGGNASLSVESLADGIDFTSTINRTRYELLASKVFGGFTRLIQEAIRKADLDILDINEVCRPEVFKYFLLSLLLFSILMLMHLFTSGNPLRRHISYAQNRRPTCFFVPPDNKHSLSIHESSFTSALLSRRSWCCYSSLIDPRIRNRRHSTVYSSYGNCHTAPTLRHRCFTIYRRYPKGRFQTAPERGDRCSRTACWGVCGWQGWWRRFGEGM